MRTYESDYLENYQAYSALAETCMKDCGKASYPRLCMLFDRWFVSRPTKLLINVSFVSLVERCLEPLFLYGFSLQELYCCAGSSEIKVNLFAISLTWWKQTSITRSYVMKMEVRVPFQRRISLRSLPQKWEWCYLWNDWWRYQLCRRHVAYTRNGSTFARRTKSTYTVHFIYRNWPNLNWLSQYFSVSVSIWPNSLSARYLDIAPLYTCVHY